MTVVLPTTCRLNLSKSNGRDEHDILSQFIGDFWLVTAQKGDTGLISECTYCIRTEHVQSGRWTVSYLTL